MIDQNSSASIAEDMPEKITTGNLLFADMIHPAHR